MAQNQYSSDETEMSGERFEKFRQRKGKGNKDGNRRREKDRGWSRGDRNQRDW